MPSSSAHNVKLLHALLIALAAHFTHYINAHPPQTIPHEKLPLHTTYPTHYVQCTHISIRQNALPHALPTVDKILSGLTLHIGHVSCPPQSSDPTCSSLLCEKTTQCS